MELTGFEPVTSCLQSRRSPTELQPHYSLVYQPRQPHTAAIQALYRFAIISCEHALQLTTIKVKTSPLAHIIRVAVLPVCLATVIACGGGDSGGTQEQGFQQVTDHDTVFTQEHLDSIGYKVSREYSTEGLEGATAALYGFWRIPDGDPVDFEVRIYQSHEDAVNLGTALADEGSGTDAVLDADDALYDEGIRDRRMIIGQGTGGGGRSGTGPRYGDYAIYGNIVMLCQGAAVEQALDRCRLFAQALNTAATGP